MSYCTPAQAMTFLDARILGDLVSDLDIRVSPAGLLTDPNLAAALSTASGQVNSAALVGERYTAAELSALVGDDANFLTMVTAWLAYGVLCSRRGRDPKQQPEYVKALELLESLRKGEALFNVPADVAVGVAQTNFPTAQVYATVNSLRTATRYYYPVRRSQRSTGA